VTSGFVGSELGGRAMVLNPATRESAGQGRCESTGPSAAPDRVPPDSHQSRHIPPLASCVQGSGSCGSRLAVGRITVTQLDWWNVHADAFSEVVAVAEWDELHVERRTVGPVIEERPSQRLTTTVEEAAVVLGISRATAYDAVARGEIPCIRIGRRILIPKVALERLLEGAGGGAQP